MVSAIRTCMACRLFFFFFQAEDGIRDLTVTGVQTCALPILRSEGNTDLNNQVSTMLVSLATDISDPLERLAAIHASSSEGKKLTGNVKAADRKSTRLNSSHSQISYAVFCLKKNRS